MKAEKTRNELLLTAALKEVLVLYPLFFVSLTSCLSILLKAWLSLKFAGWHFSVGPLKLVTQDAFTESGTS